MRARVLVRDRGRVLGRVRARVRVLLRGRVRVRARVRVRVELPEGGALIEELDASEGERAWAEWVVGCVWEGRGRGWD